MSSKKENHKWVLGSPAPLIRPHSLAKHRVIEGYLKRYVATLMSNPRRPLLKLTIVDGFAGGGQYRDSITNEFRPGSPLIALQSMAECSSDLREVRKNSVHLDVECLFIEKNKGAIDYLSDTIKGTEYAPFVDDSIHLLHGKLEDKIDAIIARIKQRAGGERAIFLLDQFGISSVDFPMIRKIMSLKNAEVILTFATDSLIDYLSESDLTQKILSRIGIELSADKISRTKQHAEWRRLIQNELHHQFIMNTGATHYTPFFIRSKDAHRDYWLVHLSGHARARDVMVGLHWEENTSFAHYGRSGIHMLGYDQDEDPAITGRLILPNFYFDATAESLCVNSLLEQIPDLISKHPGGITFDDFFAKWTNTAPATSLIFKKAIRELALTKVLNVTDNTGTERRSAGIKNGSDVITRSRVRRLFE